MKKTMFIALMGAALLSCGSGNKTEEVANEAESNTLMQEEPATATTEEASAVSNDVTLEGTDQMTFSTNEIRVKGGEKVTLTLKHAGQQPATAMGHNFVLLKQGTDVQKFAMDAMNAKDTDYVPADSPDVIAHTKVIGGGETTTISFDAPEKGTYDFICSFPGHYGMMKGSFIVE